MSDRIWAQRREFLILLPVALLLLAALSTFALLSYRNTVRILLEERRGEAVRLARLLAGELELGARLDDEELRRRLPSARAIAVRDASGRLMAATEPRALVRPSPPSLLGGEAGGGDLVSGAASYKRAGKTYTVEVDLRAAVLRSRERSLRVLTPVLLTANGVLTVLVLVLLRYFWAPFEHLIARAKEAGQELPASGDEVDFLLATFEKALAGLAGDRPQRRGELGAIEDALARSLQSGVLLVDVEGRVLALNDVGAELLDVPPPDSDSPLSAVLAPHPRLAELMDHAVRRRREVKRQECTISTSAGERTLGLTAHPLRRDDAVVRGFLVLFADLTEARREIAQRRLADSLSQLGELTAGVAHELRNGLATLRGYLTLIERAPEGETIADDLAEMRRESDHLERVLEDFLTFARPGTLRPQEVDLLALAHRAAADPALGGAAVVIDPHDDGGDRPAVRGDPQLLERALRNLVANAVEAQGGEVPEPVRIRWRRCDDGIEIVVDDRGRGLSPEAEEKLFDPFFSQRPGGVGMGLALTRRIVVLHGGRITLANRPGGGARATLWIPAGTSATIGNDRGLKEDSEIVP